MGETSVGESVAEDVERFSPGLGEPAIADLGTLVVPDSGGSPFIEYICGGGR